jgi:erythromycin esterase
MAVTTVEPGHGFTDLQPLKTTIGQAQLVALGESAHGVHEFLAFRNRLAEFLVQEMGFTAIAVETGFYEGVQVDDYIAGGTAEKTKVAQDVFEWDPAALEENLQLVEWMRLYNATASVARKIRFYGIDLTGGQSGEFKESRKALDAPLAYIERLDPSLGQEFRQQLEPFLAKFSSSSYPTLAPAERNSLTAAIADLVSLFERRRIEFVAATSESDYQRAYRNAVVARELDALFRAHANHAGNVKLKDSRDPLMVRDAGMADNVRWVLEREGPQGRVFVFAHNMHVMKSPVLKEPYPEFLPEGGRTSMGQYLRSFGDAVVVLGFSFQRGEEALKFPPLDATSVDGLLAQVGLPLFALDLRTAPKVGPVADWLSKGKRIRMNDRYGELAPIDAFDALVFVERVSGVHPIH